MMLLTTAFFVIFMNFRCKNEQKQKIIIERIYVFSFLETWLFSEQLFQLISWQQKF